MRTLIIISLFILAFQTYAGELVDTSPYLPTPVEKRGPFINRSVEDTFFEYFDSKTGKLVGRETYKNGHIERLILLKDDVKDGIQREWYQNGRLKSESPFSNGVRNGVFREWDDAGSLVARNLIELGTGLFTCYFGDGRLHEVTTYKNNKADGEFYFLNEYGRSGVGIRKEGKYVGQTITIYKDEQIYYIGNYDEEGALNGPCVHFKADGSVRDIKYFVANSEVSEDAYISAAKAAPRLPKYEIDPKNYKDSVDKRIWAILKKYRSIEPVTIPLVDK